MNQEPENQESATPPAETQPVEQTPTTPTEQTAPPVTVPSPVESAPAPVEPSVEQVPSPFAASAAPAVATTTIAPKKKPIALIAIIAVVVLALIAASVWFVFFRVSKADYKKASTALDTVHTTYDKLRTDLSNILSDINASSEEDTVKTDGDKLKTDLATYKQQFDDFASQRALKDKDVKQKYDAAVAQNKKFVAFIESMTGSLDTLQNVGADCAASRASSLSGATGDTILTVFDEAVGPCMSDLAKLAKSQNAAIAKYASTVLDIYKDLRDGISDMQAAYIAKNSSAYYAARSKVSSTTSKFYSVSSKDLRTAASDVQISSQMTDLDKILSQKTA